MIRRKWLYETPYFTLFFLVIFFLCAHTPNTGGDTPSYIDFSLTRPPVYPMFIWLFHWAGRYQFYLIMWAQSLITFCSLLYARNWLRKNIEISDILIFFVLLITLTTISFHFQMFQIQSEGLAFPFFIFTFFLSVESFQKFHIKQIIFLAIWVSILILTRLQFYFFYGVFIFLIFWYIWKRIPTKSIILCAAFFLISILLTTFIDRAYHDIKNGTFSSEPAVGLSSMIQPIFLANPDAAIYFNNNTEKKDVQNMLDKIKKKN